MKLFDYRIFALTVLAFIASCNRNDPDRDTNSLDRKPMLIHWADNVIIPSYESFETRMDVMVTKANAFTGSPNLTTLSEFRQAWVDAYTEWQKVELFEIGPADKYTLRNFFNIYPTSITTIETHITDPSISLDVPAAYAAQGFPALDYLINGVRSTDDQIVAYFTTETDSQKRRDYITRLIERMHSLWHNVIGEWSTYRDTFITKTGLDIGSSTGLMVNAYVLYYERYIRSGKFGIPSGAITTTGGIVYPDKVEAYYKKDISLTLAKTAHQAAIDFFNGKNPETGEEGPSLKSYLDALDAKDVVAGKLLSTLINEQFAVVNASMDPLSENISSEVQNNNQAVLNVFAEMQKATRMLKVDMTSAMSITITYTDNDGD